MSKEKIQAPRGTLDMEPKDAGKWQTVERIARDVAALFNFKEIRSPEFEHTELFHRGAGETTDLVRKETYDFKDRGDRALTLRIDPAAKPARAALPAAAIKARRGALPVAIRCRLVTAPCRGTARIARRGTVLASVRLSIPAGGSATRRLAHTRAGRTALAGGATIKATLALAIRTGSRTTTATQPIRIHS